jgi:hypothetical protein
MSEISQTMHFARNEFGIVRAAVGCLHVGVSIDMMNRWQTLGTLDGDVCDLAALV